MGDPGGSNPVGGGGRRPPIHDAPLRARKPVVPPAPPDVQSRPPRVAGDPNTLEGSGLKSNTDYRRRAFFGGEGVGFEFYVPLNDKGREFFVRLASSSEGTEPTYRPVTWQGQSGFVPAGQYDMYAAAAGLRLNQTTSGRNP